MKINTTNVLLARIHELEKELFAMYDIIQKVETEGYSPAVVIDELYDFILRGGDFAPGGTGVE